jgi:hypothetical protein
MFRLWPGYDLKVLDLLDSYLAGPKLHTDSGSG